MSTEKFGNLEYITKKNDYFTDKLEGYWKIIGSQPSIMASRIVPGCWSKESGTVNIPDNLSNIENIEWLMLRYPLDILSPDRWMNRIEELNRQKEKRRQIKQLNQIESVSGRFKGTLRDFQKEGLDFLLKSSGVALLADEMGLGKTVEALAYLVTEEDAFPALIVAPLATLQNWKREVEKFIEKSDRTRIRVNVIREGRAGSLDAADIYVINYDLLSKRRDDLERAGLKTIICDEIQALRGMNSQKTLAVKELANVQTVKHRMGLSGTPCYNHGTELWSIVDFIYPGLLGTYSEFRHEFIGDWDERSIVPSRRAGLYEILTQNIMLRRRKDDVLKDLPPKVRYRQVVEIDKAYYEAEMRKHLDRLRQSISESESKAKTDFRGINRAYDVFTENERQVAGVSKVPFVVEFVQAMMENEEPVIVFCHHIAVHELLQEKLREFSPVSIIGGQSDTQRQNAIDMFQGGMTKLMIAGLRAGSLGINLTAARYIIFAELDWSPAIHRQSEDRAHRIGQKGSVFAYYLEGQNTYDGHIAEILVDKKLEIDEILGDATKGQEFTEPERLSDKTSQIIRLLESRYGKIKPVVPEAPIPAENGDDGN